VVWGKQAENCAQYLSKGRPCYIEGRLQTRQWDDKEGNKRYTTEIVAQRVQFLGSRKDGGAQTDEPAAPAPANSNPGFADGGNSSDDVPF